jgi:hypothetical protein
MKTIEEIEVLPISFFSILLQYRKFAQENTDFWEDFSKWHEWNFEREKQICQNVEKNLGLVFAKEWRISDIWLQKGQNGSKSFLKESLNKMDGNLNNIKNISKNITKITQSLSKLHERKSTF